MTFLLMNQVSSPQQWEESENQNQKIFSAFSRSHSFRLKHQNTKHSKKQTMQSE